jgi:rhodanese-related sulfurtransferase
MAQNITQHVEDMVAAAEREIETLPAADAIALYGSPGVTFVDLRDIRELDREGRVPGAFHCPRGMLEFWLDPASKYHKPVFAGDGKFVFFCAAGSRSALATQYGATDGARAGRPYRRRLWRLARRGRPGRDEAQGLRSR